MSDITSAVLKLAKKLNGPVEPESRESDGDQVLLASCPLHILEESTEYCTVYLNRYRAEHHWDGQYEAFEESTFEDFAEAVAEQDFPGKTIEALRAELLAEGKLDWVWEGMLLPGNITLL